MSDDAVVIDTNWVLDAWVFADARATALRLAVEAGRVRWLATGAMRAELARVLDYPAHADYSTSLMLHLDAPGLDRLAVRAYAHDESCDDLPPGDLITVKMKLRSAEKRYGEETDAYLSMGIAAIGSVTDAPVKTGEWKYKIL